MAARQNRRTPAFFWQGMLIMLPVAVLAAASFVSLRQDERATEADARNRAVENVQSLARAMRSSVNEELQRFLTLQNVWMTGVRLAGQPSITGVFPDTKLQADIEKWERDYPGLKLAELAVPQGEILADGRQIAPPDFPDVPRPPKWFRELSPAQIKLWEALRTSGGPAEIEKWRQAFWDSQPSRDAQQAVFDLFQPPEQMVGHSNFLPTETGISFEEIACYRLLTATNAQLTDSLLQSLWWQVMDHPSFVSPRLLDLAEGLTNRAGRNLQRNFFWTGQFWRSQSKTRTWLERVRDEYKYQMKGWSTQKCRAFWAGGFDGGALAFFTPCTFTNMGSDADGTPFSGHGFEAWFVPRKVVKAIFDRALTENKVFIPDYASAVVSVEGKQFVSIFDHVSIMQDHVFVLPARQNRQFVSNDEILAQFHWQLLGTATQSISAPMTPDAASFDVNLCMTSREQMLSTERRRAKLFGALILGAALTAFVGLLAARHAFRRQLQLNEQKSDFVSSVSHELRAPIASVRLMAENLERGKILEPARQGEYFHFIVQECRRLSSLIENVLDFSRIEQGRKQYEFEPTNLVALAETTVKLMEPYAAEKGVRLEFHSALRTPNSELALDGRAIQQALVNLIDNAVKHSPKGETVTVEIETNNASSPEPLNLSVSDHGPGIPAVEHEKIFERFYRLGSELRRETQGVGIGLSVVKHIVEAHRGRVRVESKVGHGSRFIIELPVTNAKTQSGQDAEIT